MIEKLKSCPFCGGGINMARIFEPAQQKKIYDDKIVLGILEANLLNNYYKLHKQGFAVNDGKFIKFVDDREESNMTFCEMHKKSGCPECPNRYVCKNSTLLSAKGENTDESRSN